MRVKSVNKLIKIELTPHRMECRKNAKGRDNESRTRTGVGRVSYHKPWMEQCHIDSIQQTMTSVDLMQFGCAICAHMPCTHKMLNKTHSPAAMQSFVAAHRYHVSAAQIYVTRK